MRRGPAGAGERTAACRLRRHARLSDLVRHHPRHLAGPGDARHVTHGLAAAGWTRTSDPLSPEIVLRSPDHRHSLQFDPQSATSAWWRLRAKPTDAEPGWYAEILASLTDALTASTSARRIEPLQVLESAGWLINGEDAAHTSDVMCHVKQRSEQGEILAGWHVETREPGHGTQMSRRIWHAWFDGHTPAHLVDAFVTSLADTAPLQRGMYERTAHHSVVQKPSPLTPEQSVQAHTARLAGIREQARAAQRQHRTNATTPPPKAGTVRSPARR
ncbi:DUF317 domain-containing protein [Streptomyces sp. NPDC059011]|uniref:DUF317 domain-containing protein n=1 Tax=unclassified Streptomyces TaxID=2593676 RepID=UPI003696F622